MYNCEKRSLTYIAKQLKIAPKTIKKILIDNNIPIRNFAEQSSIVNKERRFTNRKYSLNYKYFETLNEDSAYILGFISADGGVYKGRLKIEIQRRDRYLLEYIKNSLEFTGDVVDMIAKIKEKEYETSRLQISSTDLCESLIKYGVTENKHLTICPINIPEEYELSYVKGYFDGNGFTKTREYACFGVCSGSYDMIKYIANILHKNGLKMANIHKAKDKSLYDIEYSQKDSMLFYDLMYKNNTVCLTRKKEYFERYIN